MSVLAKGLTCKVLRSSRKHNGFPIVMLYLWLYVSLRILMTDVKCVPKLILRLLYVPATVCVCVCSSAIITYTKLNHSVTMPLYAQSYWKFAGSLGLGMSS